MNVGLDYFGERTGTDMRSFIVNIADVAHDDCVPDGRTLFFVDYFSSRTKLHESLRLFATSVIISAFVPLSISASRPRDLATYMSDWNIESHLKNEYLQTNRLLSHVILLGRTENCYSKNI